MRWLAIYAPIMASPDPDQLLITRGGQTPLLLAARAILAPGQAIAVKDPGYPLGWSAFRTTSAEMRGVPEGSGGMSWRGLLDLARRRALYAR